MNISKYTVEDFVLNEEFKAWVFSPNQGSNAYWARIFEQYPGQIKNAKIAKEILLNLNYSKYQMSEKESLELWEEIASKTEDTEIKESPDEGKLVWLNSASVLRRQEIYDKPRSWFSQELRVACILILTFSFSLIFNFFTKKQNIVEVLQAELIYQEYAAPPGVKSTLTLQDGSRVMLNSGSSIRFLKNFEPDRRIIFLEGEAFFEVSKDTLRPFSVITGVVETTALGTSFNISAYPNEDLKVALVEGLVSVMEQNSDTSKVFLEKGESLKINPESGAMKKGHFDPALVLAWTKKKIVFQKVKLAEAIRVLENWYGVEFKIQNNPSPDLVLYGVFEDETLENVLIGLSYSARFQYKIDKDEVKIIFN